MLSSNHVYLAAWRIYRRFSKSWPWNAPKRSFNVKGHDALLFHWQRWTFVSIDTFGHEQSLRRCRPLLLSWPWNDLLTSSNLSVLRILKVQYRTPISGSYSYHLSTSHRLAAIHVRRLADRWRRLYNAPTSLYRVHALQTWCWKMFPMAELECIVTSWEVAPSDEGTFTSRWRPSKYKETIESD